MPVSPLSQHYGHPLSLDVGMKSPNELIQRSYADMNSVTELIQRSSDAGMNIPTELILLLSLQFRLRYEQSHLANIMITPPPPPVILA
jgi:hypothetical protein